jgi:hypothetical protein
MICLETGVDAPYNGTITYKEAVNWYRVRTNTMRF